MMRLALCGCWLAAAAGFAAAQPPVRVLGFYATNVEGDHVAFAKQALQFFGEKARKHRFEFDSTTRWDDLNPGNIGRYKAVLWLNDSPHTQRQRDAFEQYMAQGGAWLGFHAAAYNDKDTHWPWFVSFLGGGVFYGNNWPPLPAKLKIDDRRNPVTKDMPGSLTSPANEWYSWEPSPRLNKDVKVLATLDAENYPLGLKDTLTGGDIPVVWSNTRYKMIYMNMGHGDKIFTEAAQNLLMEKALLSLLGMGD